LQIAICSVLVTASLVAVRGLARSLQTNYGIQPQGVMLAKTDLKMAGYDGDQRVQMQKRMLEAAAAIPGVATVAVANRLPLSIGGGDSEVFTDATTDFRPTNAAADAENFEVSPDYFRAAGTTMVAGRSFTMHDEDKAPVVAVVNQQFARKVFGSADNAIGKHFKFWGGSQRAEVIGIVEDGKYQTLTEDQKPAMFFSFLQHPSSETWLIVRSDRGLQGIAPALQRSLHNLDPALPLEIRTWNREMDSALFAARVATVSLGVLGVLGAMLAITGIFGMAAYTVSKRIRELGIRIALGADRGKVLGAALGRTFRLLAVGSIAGMILGILATRVLSSIVYQATPKDPVILGGVILTMLCVGVVAALIPARRALAVDPMILLRDQ
jgi:predicted permease